MWKAEKVLPEIVSSTHGAFVTERLILENIIIAHEMVHAHRTNDRVSKKFMAIKTDMSKAYDRVEWPFLESLLERMGFDRIWITWLVTCVNSVSYYVLLNGQTHGFIKPEQGKRKGDPLSPFLFILVASDVSRMQRVKERSMELIWLHLVPRFIIYFLLMIVC